MSFLFWFIIFNLFFLIKLAYLFRTLFFIFLLILQLNALLEFLPSKQFAEYMYWAYCKNRGERYGEEEEEEEELAVLG